jgi:hypothetical protein
MAQTFIQAQEAIVSYLNVTIADAPPAGLTVNGVNLVALAINNAKRTAERSYDFYYCQTNGYLEITEGGSLVSQALPGITPSLSVSGGTPNPGGTYTIIGAYNGLPLWGATVSSVVYTIFYNGTAWILTSGGFTPTNYWSYTTASTSPIGTYTASGSNTGSPFVIGAGSSYLSIKNIDNVLVPISGGYVPIEFLTQETWQERIRQQIGRQPYTPGNTLAQYGFSLDNPVAVQQGQMLYLQLPTDFTFPITVQLDCSIFLPDYVADSDTDFFLQFAPEFIMWQGILECNKLTKFFVQRREGNLEEPNLEAFAQQAFQSLIEWDQSISQTTGTPARLRLTPPAQREPAPAAK